MEFPIRFFMQRPPILCLLIGLLCTNDYRAMADERGAAPPKTAAAVYGQGVRETPKLSPQEEAAGFHLPEGFVAELVASEPQIAKPLNMAFDRHGQLWITDTTEYPYPAPTGAPAHDTIKVLADKDQNGSYETVTTFADGLNIPIGILPTDDGVICFSIPNLMHLRDRDGDGKCDERKVILGPFDTTRDTHGMINSLHRGRDGWIYACHGFNNQSHVKAADGSEIHLISGNTFRFRIDGSHVEQYTNGQVNPFGMTADQWGNWFTADCHSKPVTMLVRGGYYESFGRPHDGLGFVPAVMDHLHGSTAICGIACYLDDEYPQEFQRKFYSGNVMTSRINCNKVQVDRDRIRLVEEPDFLTSDDPWFRPVDIQLGADGALYVADFYNKIIGHYEVRLDHPERDRTSGRIWRIVYRGNEKNKPAQGNAITESTLLSSEHLAQVADANQTRQHFAFEKWAQASLNAAQQAKTIQLQTSAGSSNMQVRIAAVWAAHRLGFETEATLAAALPNASPELTATIYKAWADRPRAELSSATRALLSSATAALASDTPQLAIAAAEALATHGQAAEVVALLEQVKQRATDAAIVPHAMRIALKKLLQDDAIAKQVLAPASEKSVLSSPEQAMVLATVLPAVGTPAAAQALLALVSTGGDKFASYRGPALQLACKQMRPEFTPGVIELLKSLKQQSPPADDPAAIFAAPMDEQTQLALEAFATLQAGKHSVPAELSQLLNSRLQEICRAVDQEISGSASARRIVWQGSNGRPWDSEDRKRNGSGARAFRFISSLTLDEDYVGTYATQAFECPTELTFWLCGHDGPPNMPPGKKNLVRLVLAENNQTLAQQAPPRNDVAQKVTWDLKEHAGKSVRFECVDGDNGDAYAWLAVSGFSMPGLNPSRIDAVVPKLSRLLETLGARAVDEHKSSLDAAMKSSEFGAEGRARLAASICLARQLPLGKLLADVAVLRGQAAAVRGELALAENAQQAKAAKELAIVIAAHLTLSQQAQFVRGLIGTAEGRRLLIELVDEGRMATESLRMVKEILAGGDKDEDSKRLIALSEAAMATPSASEQAMAARIALFKHTTGDFERGKALYEKNCANCHKLRGAGQLVGPQLDGVGPRGPERLAEDILLPNRNVDKAFRMSSLLMEDNRVLVGLIREAADGSWQLVGTDGKTQAVERDQVAMRKDTTKSLMPDNFGELINDQDLNHLLQFIMRAKE